MNVILVVMKSLRVSARKTRKPNPANKQPQLKEVPRWQNALQVKTKKATDWPPFNLNILKS